MSRIRFPDPVADLERALSPTRQRILAALPPDGATTVELVEALHWHMRRRSLRRNLDELANVGLVEVVRHDPPAGWGRTNTYRPVKS